MNIWSHESYIEDLNSLAQLMSKYDAAGIGNWHNLSTYAHKLKPNETINIDIDFLIQKKISKTIPNEVNQFKIFFEFMCKTDLTVDLNRIDPIVEYSFQLTINGITNDRDSPYINSWHLDRHIVEEGDGEPKYTHPLYHFQYGGKRLESISSTGDLLLIGAPRLPHPPMDVFLGIHFILNNYFNRHDYAFLNQIYDDFDYQEIMKRAKQRMWTPYFSAFNLDSQHQDFTLSKIFPLAI